MNKVRDIGKKQLKKQNQMLFKRCMQLEEQVRALAALVAAAEDTKKVPENSE